jgi:hypothetical protein
MALNHSPSVVTNGLVLYYDMANTQKSWKGAPATNLIPSASTMTGWSNYSSGTPVLISTSFGTTGYGMYNLATWNGVNRSITIPSTGTYTFSVWIRYFGGSVNNNGGAIYISGWGGVDSASYVDKTKLGVWQRVSITLNCTNLTFTIFIISWGGTNNGASDYSTWEVTMPQAEAGSIATPFVDGTRSNTQALVDLTNNNTITASSLTYAADNTFSFNGNANYIQTTSNCGITGSVTLSAWIKPSYSGQTGPHSTIISTDTDYPYGAKLMNYKNSARYGIWLGFSGVDNYEAFVAADINDNTIKLLTASWNQTTGVVNIYLNGVLTSTQSTGKTIPVVLSTGKITLGTDYNSIGSANKNKFLGNIYNAQVYNRALSAAEILQNFNALRGRYGL